MALPQQTSFRKPVTPKPVLTTPPKKSLDVPTQPKPIVAKTVKPAVSKSVPLTKPPQSTGSSEQPMEGEKKWYQKWWVWLIVIVGILVIVGAVWGIVALF